MKSADIKIGETYTFMGSESPARQHLAGEPFTVTEIKSVWRRVNRGRRKVNRFFNADGIGARADELEPRDDDQQSAQPELRDFTEPFAPSPWGD